MGGRAGSTGPQGRGPVPGGSPPPSPPTPQPLILSTISQDSSCTHILVTVCRCGRRGPGRQAVMAPAQCCPDVNRGAGTWCGVRGC